VKPAYYSGDNSYKVHALTLLIQVSDFKTSIRNYINGAWSCIIILMASGRGGGHRRGTGVGTVEKV